MKLRNKILPFIGVAATAATIAPLALTSCKSNSDIELIDITDGTKAVPTIAPMESETWMGQTDFTTAYIKAVKANPEIFKQDFINGMYDNLVVEWQGHQNYKYLRVGCTTPTFGVANVSYPGEPDVQYPTISLTYKIQFSRDEERMDGSSYYIRSQVMDMTITLNNIPLMISLDTNKKGNACYWVEMPNFESYSYIWQFNLNPWSIDYSYNLNDETTTFTQSGKTVTKNNDTDSGTVSKFSELSFEFEEKMSFGFYSHYLSQITPAPEFISYKVYAGSEEITPYYPGPVPAPVAGLENIAHGFMGGLYMPATNYDIDMSKVSVALFAGYDDNGEPTGNVYIEQVLPAGAEETARRYIKFSNEPQEYKTDGNGWNKSGIIYHNSPYTPYQFPKNQVVDYLDANSSIKPTSGAAGKEQFIFALPKSVVVQFIYKTTVLEKEVEIKWNQQVWLSQDEMSAVVNFTTAP